MVVLVWLASSLQACLPTPGSPIGTATPIPNTANPAEAYPVKIIPFFTTESDPQQIAILQELIAEYQQLNPEVEIDIVLASPASRGRRLLTALASNADLGIFEIEPTLMVDWAEAGYFLPLDDVVAEIGAEDFVPGSLFSYQGHVYALPYATSVYGLWVRKDLFEKAGLPLPSTYQQALSAAKTLTQGETYGIALPAGQNIATVNYFSTFLWQNGGDYFNCAGELTFEEPQALEAVRRWKALAKYAPPGFTTWGFTEQIEAFLRGRVAMSMYAGRLGLELVERNPELEDKVSVVFPPWGPEKVTLGVWSRFAIAKGTRHPEEAKAFLTWLLQGDRLLRYDMVLPGHMIPPLKTVQEMAESYASPFIEKHPDWYAAFNDWVRFTNHPAMNMGAMEGGHFVGSNAVPPWGREVFGTPGIVDDMLQAITLGKQPEEEAWQEAVQEMGAVLTEWKAQHPDWKPSACR